jgi:hypothetical protein
MRAFRSRLTYANVTSSIALFLALGGGAVWAASELGRNDVTAKNLAPKSVGASELKPNSAKGADVDEASLGTVPSAGRADSAARADTADTATVAGRAGAADTADNAGSVDGYDAGALVRTAAANTANALPPNTDGTILTTTIQAPAAGFLTVIASATHSYGVADDQVECALQIDETTIANSRRVFNLSGAAEVDSGCATNATRQVAAGSHKVDLEALQVQDSDVGAAELSVIFTPFGATGSAP